MKEFVISGSLVRIRQEAQEKMLRNCCSLKVSWANTRVAKWGRL